MAEYTARYNYRLRPGAEAERVLAESFSDLDPARPRPVAFIRLLNNIPGAEGNATDPVVSYGFTPGCSCGGTFPPAATVAALAAHISTASRSHRPGEEAGIPWDVPSE